MTEKQKQLSTGAKISLLVLLLSTVWQFISIYRTSYQLNSPIIPESTIWQINKEYILTAFIFTVVSIIGLIFYFYDKYLWVIILIIATLIASRFTYLPT